MVMETGAIAMAAGPIPFFRTKNLKFLLRFLIPVSLFFGGLLLLGFSPEVVGVSFLLLLLITAQGVLYRRHIRKGPPVGGFGGRWEAPAPSRRSRAPSPVEGRAAIEEAVPRLEPGVFSKFRSHLEKLETSPDAPAQKIQGAEKPAPGTVPPTSEGLDETDDGEIKLSLSAKGRKLADSTGMAAYRQAGGPQAGGKPPKGSPLSKTPLPGKDTPPDEGDLFADLRPDYEAAGDVIPPTGPLTKPAKPEPGKRAGSADAGGGKPSPLSKPLSKSTPPDVGDEVIQALAGEPGLSGENDDADLNLLQARDAEAKGNLVKAKNHLKSYLDGRQSQPETIPREAWLMNARVEAIAGNPAGAAQAFGALLEKIAATGEVLTEAGLPKLLDEIQPEKKGAAGAAVRVALLQKALAVFRQDGDRPAMDRLYTRIESIQEEAGDEGKLVQFFKNHLEIRRAMGDVKGQLDLIDQLGARLFKLGDTDGAKKYYEMGLQLRGGEPPKKGS